MKKLNKLIALTSLLALFTGQLQGQEYQGDPSVGYAESNQASYLAAALPIGAIVVAAVLIATTDRHHSHGSSGSSSSSHSSHFSHSH